MANDIKVVVGTKITDEEAKKLGGPATMGIALAGQPKASEVEGQASYYSYIQCPGCGLIDRARLDTDYYKWFSCGNCGTAFRK
jgi:predicted RNA-binding Zn-ribbon protein involved in translation (DUF1610 family)